MAGSPLPLRGEMGQALVLVTCSPHPRPHERASQNLGLQEPFPSAEGSQEVTSHRLENTERMANRLSHAAFF